MPEIGQSLLHYSITEKIGKGGMGEVYRARDQKLGREVAIKVLPEEFARDADRIARFQREAKLLASLNHPNIAAIYGLEESGGTNFLVLELAEGQTLADRINAGPIPIEESLKLALQIAEALEAAHEKGVIHRDLKPANIKVTPDGKVKVLDFGLAKAFAGEQAELNLSNSPTLSNAATQQGVILGTAAYMSPEQAKGKTVDKRTDIWAFGCVLFEMLTGQAAFQGEDITEILASVVKGGANLDLLPASIHPRVREVLTRCLQKDLKRRYQDIGDVRYDIEQALAEPPGSLAQPIPASGHHRKLRRIAPWLAAVVIICIITGLAVWKLKPAESRRIVRFYHDLPEGQQFSKARLSVLAVSADGNQFVYCTPKGIYARSLNESSAKLISGTEGDPEQPFFSPDGKWIGYFSASDRQLKKIAINGGTPVTLCDVRNLYGACWDESNTIVFGQLTGDIMSIPANGGRAEAILRGKLPILPQILPGRKTVLYTEPTSNTQGKIVVQPLKSGKPKELFAAYGGARYLSTGHIVYRTGNTLFAVPFDLKRMETTGGPVPVVEGAREAVISDSGTLVYIPGNAVAATPALNLVWVNREGKEQPLSAPVNSYGYPSNSSPRISPDGTRVALTFSTGANENIWIWDLVRERMTRLTFDEGENGWPLWSPDSKRIVYRSRDHEINRRAADGSGEVERFGSLPDQNIPGPFCWSADKKTFLSWDLNLSPLQTDITMISLEGGLVRKPLFQEKYNKDHPQISPEGRWLAYASAESGQNEVYVRPFPEVNKGRWQVSMDGGNGPLWSPHGRELFYRNGDSVMAVPVETEPTFKPGKPKVLFRGTYFSDNIGQGVLPRWDISPDGKRFLMMKESGKASTGEAPRKINIVLNWLEELKQRVPAP
jgi:serine/threonine protein kinase